MSNQEKVVCTCVEFSSIIEYIWYNITIDDKVNIQKIIFPNG